MSPENTSKSRNIYLKNCSKNENRKKIRVQKAQKVRKSQMDMSHLGITSVCPKKPQNHERIPMSPSEIASAVRKKRKKCPFFRLETRMMLGVLMAIFENEAAQNAERDLRKKRDFSRFFEQISQRDLR